MKKKFSSWLLMGKVATLPMLIQSARADVTPGYTDITTSNLNVMVLPDVQISLKNIHTDTSSLPSNAGNSYSSTLLCTTATGTTLPSKLSVVVTGVRADETVYLVGALSKNDPLNLVINPKITIGTNGMVILGTATVTGSPNTVSAVTIPVDLTVNHALVAAGKFYMQAASVMPSTPPSAWRISELDTVSVGNKTYDSYGQVTAYCV